MKKVRVFVMTNARQFEFGNGVRHKVACFPQGVHAEFSIMCHNQDDDLMSVGSVKKCDGSCVNQTGILIEFGGKPSSMSYDTRPIVRAVERYVARQAERRVKTAAKAKK